MPATQTAIALSTAERRRLERLAREAGRTPKAMLHFVLRDGFDYTEQFVKEVKKGLADADAGKTVSHAEAASRLDAHLKAKHAAKPRKAA